MVTNQAPVQLRILQESEHLLRESVGSACFFPRTDDTEDLILLRTTLYVVLSDFQEISSAISHGSGFNVLKVLNSRIFRDGEVDAERRREEVGIRNIAKVLTLTGRAYSYW